ncbi:triacylglycerol lipase [Ancylostoma duodenale]|uniref:Triacylglycerol lipase n=1 Tax=Ancylostoma duodenale TaxID=51022 RepID=A0A0C2CAV3_9BILA|nr:triacylglycerol lipase [Ancylostoma duodenale]
MDASFSGLIVTKSKNKDVALSFRANLPDPYSPESWNKSYLPLKKWEHEGKVSSFLAEGCKDLWLGVMRKRFQNIVKNAKTKEVLITGHYLGGALAALVALDIVKGDLVKNDSVTVITLGQMMVGDKEFAKAYEEKIENSFRVVHKLDLISLVPSEENGYAFNGNEVLYDKIGMQMNGTTGYKICKQNECSGKQIRPLNSTQNDVYFKKNVTTYVAMLREAYIKPAICAGPGRR